MIEFITADDFKTKIFDFENNKDWAFSGKPTLLNFTASWCGPCRMFAPTLETLAEKYQGQVDIFKIDIDQQPQLPAMFGIRSVPTTLFLVKGEDPIMAGGVISEDQMIKAVDELLTMGKK